MREYAGAGLAEAICGMCVDDFIHAFSSLAAARVSQGVAELFLLV